MTPEQRVREAREWVTRVRDGMPGFGSSLNEAWEEQLIALSDALTRAEQERDAFEQNYTAVGVRNKELHDQHFALVAELAEARARAARLDGHLWFYAHAPNWLPLHTAGDDRPMCVRDGGERARAALATAPPPPATATLLVAIDAEANLAGLMCEADDADIAAQHIERIRALIRGAVRA